MPTTSAKEPLYFYHFLGAHSLLIGLLPFFLPVYLWTHGLGLAGLSLLVGISGIAFASSLWVWQFLSHRYSLKHLIALTFVLEITVVMVVGLFTVVPGMALFQASGAAAAATTTPTLPLVWAAVVIGFFNGLYNAFFWTTQRTLFLQQLGQNDTGKQYGNFQIFVTVFLKAGILLGGFLLDSGGFVWLLGLSAGVGAASTLWLARARRGEQPLTTQSICANSLQALTFTDKRGSRPTFAIDGIFLYLESHFWTLSLFLIVRQDFSRLGIAVVLLALGFAVLFFLIKNRIDRLAIERLYRAAVVLYACSWLLRFTLTDNTDGTSLLVTLMVITFFSSFFRLAFNKRFFDVARQERAVRYLLLKSYSSQWILGLFFSLLGTVLFIWPSDAQFTLQIIYLGAALLSVTYFVYRDNDAKASHEAE